jgi:Golgi apparatus protein 1
MKCLQKKYDQLESTCKAVVRNFTEMTMTDPTLDFLLMKACEPMIQLFCAVNEIFLICIFKKILL